MSQALTTTMALPPVASLDSYIQAVNRVPLLSRLTGYTGNPTLFAGFFARCCPRSPPMIQQRCNSLPRKRFT